MTLHTTLLMASLLFLYQAITFWYPTVLVQMGRQTLPFLVAFNAGGVTGAFVGGRLSETALGRRGAMSLVTLIGVVSIPLFLYSSNTAHHAWSARRPWAPSAPAPSARCRAT